MADLTLMPARADASPDFLHRIAGTTRRATAAGGIGTVAAVAERRPRVISRRELDCLPRYGSAVVSWSDVACAWLFMMAAAAALLE